jgi:hypothetical protein
MAGVNSGPIGQKRAQRYPGIDAPSLSAPPDSPPPVEIRCPSPSRSVFASSPSAFRPTGTPRAHRQTLSPSYARVALLPREYPPFPSASSSLLLTRVADQIPWPLRNMRSRRCVCAYSAKRGSEGYSPLSRIAGYVICCPESMLPGDCEWLFMCGIGVQMWHR